MASDSELFSNALALPPEKRARLAWELLASLDEGEEEEVDVAEEWGREIERRAEEISSGRVNPEDWATVRQRLLERRRKNRP